jgi:hypothetical protein
MVGGGTFSDQQLATMAGVCWRTVLRSQDYLRKNGIQIQRFMGKPTTYILESYLLVAQPVASDKMSEVTPDKMSEVGGNPCPEPTQTLLLDSESVKVSKKEPSLRSGRAREAKKLPTDWEPNADEKAYAVKHRIDPTLAAEDFRNYWLGCGKPMKNWSATWRNRVLALVDYNRFRLPEPEPANRYGPRGIAL